jgi:hypothetical protein
MARILIDDTFRADFRRNPHECAERAGLSPAAVQALAHSDLDGLDMTAESLAAKRQADQREHIASRR